MSSLETIAPDESQRFEQLAQKMVTELSAEPAGRTLHVRAHAGVAAVLHVDQVAAPFNVGLFAKPARYDAWVRFSSGAARRQADSVPDVRGMAVKIVGVEGPKLIPGLEAATTQDFLCILTSTFAFQTPEAFADVAHSAAKGQFAVLKAVIRHSGFFGALKMLPRLTKSLDKSGKSLFEHTYFTALPILMGETAAKIRFRPIAVPPPVEKADLTPELTHRLRGGPAMFALEAQPFVDQQRTPIENPAVEWPTEWVQLARLELPMQDAASPEGKKRSEYVETLSFDPWHALVQHRPLGATMRARAVAYRVAVMRRHARSELEVVGPSAV